MDEAIRTLIALGLMATVVVVFRAVIRRPRGVSQHDPPGVRTLVVFSGDDPALFADDPAGEPYVGIGLFQTICDGLETEAIGIENRGTIQNAQRAECVVAGKRLAIVLESIDGSWVASIEYIPSSAAERRHLSLTQMVYSPPDSQALRRILSALDLRLKGNHLLGGVAWYRKERWIAEDTSDPSDTPFG